MHNMDILKNIPLKQVIKTYFIGVVYFFMLTIVGSIIITIYNYFYPTNSSSQFLLIVIIFFTAILVAGFMLLFFKQSLSPIAIVFVISPLLGLSKLVKNTNIIMMFHMKTKETNKSADTKTKIILLLQRANEFICMSTGLNSDFYNDADIKKAMVDAFGRVKLIRILIEGDVEAKRAEVGWFFDVTKELKEKAEIKQIGEVLHWLIVDGKHFRLEELHHIGEVGQKNLFVCDSESSVVSDILISKFDNWWITGNPINL